MYANWFHINLCVISKLMMVLYCRRLYEKRRSQGGKINGPDAVVYAAMMPMSWQFSSRPVCRGMIRPVVNITSSLRVRTNEKFGNETKLGPCEIVKKNHRRVRNIFYVRALELNQRSLPKNRSFIASISASICRTSQKDSHISDLYNFGRFNAF